MKENLKNTNYLNVNKANGKTRKIPELTGLSVAREAAQKSCMIAVK